ncbi:MAG: DUF5687 family protein [Bacteroidales bacterium]|nr:DUF5687 family protein [Bacteroidales bacterium]
MIKWFIIHQFKQSFRSTIWQKNLIINIILGFFVFIIILEVLVGGIYLADKWQEIFPDSDPVSKFNGFIGYYFAFAFILRFFMQNVPVLTIQPYLHLPVKKSSLINYVLVKSFLNFFNFLPLFFVIPFAILQLSQFYPLSTVWVWLLSIILLVLSNNLLIVYLKKQLVANSKIVAFFGLFIAALLLLDYFKLISFSELSTAIFGHIIEYPYLIIILVLIMLSIYILNYFFLKSHLYPEEINIKKEKKTNAITNIKYLQTLGIIGEIIALDIKLYWRNKRTKTIIYMTPIFLLYGLFFYPQETSSEGFGFLIFIGIFMTGGLMLNYLNYAFSWEGRYFDYILTSNIDAEKYIRVKFIISLLVCTFSFVVTIPYVLFGVKILLINFITFLFNIGVISFVLLYNATFNKKSMDLSKGATFNYQGMGASNWLVMLPVFLLPIFIYFPFNYFGVPYTGLIVVGLLGISGLLFNKSILKIITKQFYKRKYKMAEGFREKG